MIAIRTYKSGKQYAYLIKTTYKRDKRTIKKKPSWQGDGTARKERGKYSKKKFIYLGKIKKITFKKYFDFKEYIEEKTNLSLIEIKTNFSFKKIMEHFRDYLLKLNNLNYEEYISEKFAYDICGGIFCKKTFDWVLSSHIIGNHQSNYEIKRFTKRCMKIGIFDEEIIKILYLKLVPDIEKNKLKKALLEEFEELDKKKEENKKVSYDYFMKNLFKIPK
jgi:hypothetical protein